MIPKIFHHVWLGNKPFPSNFILYRMSWMIKHPTWTFMFWTDENLPFLINSFEYENAKNYAQKCDVVKYELVWRFGGIYVDADFECLKNLEDLLENCKAFSASESEGLISAGIFGCEPQNEIFKNIISALPQSFKNEIPGRQDLSTGPGLITKEGKNLKIFGPEMFYPYHFTEKHRKNENFPNAYAVHHWANSWGKNKKLFD